MTETTVRKPRTRDGAEMRLLDGEAYCVAVDERRREVSNRASGRVWVAQEDPQTLEVFFVPDDVDCALKIARRGHVAEIKCVTDELPKPVYFTFPAMEFGRGQNLLPVFKLDRMA